MRKSGTRSFSAGVKDELNRLPPGKACCMLSEISALTQTSGHLAFRGGGWISASYRLDNAGTARRLFQLLKKRLDVAPKLHFVQTRQLGGRRSCVLTLGTEDTRVLLNALHKLYPHSNLIGVSDAENIQTALLLHRIHASDYLIKPYDINELIRTIK